MPFVVDLCGKRNDALNNDGKVVAVCAEEDEYLSNDDNLSFIAEADLLCIDGNPPYSSFLLRRRLHSSRSMELLSMHEHLHKGQRSRFHGLRLHACANDGSVMSKEWYIAKCSASVLRASPNTSNCASIEEIGRRRNSMESSIV